MAAFCSCTKQIGTTTPWGELLSQLFVAMVRLRVRADHQAPKSTKKVAQRRWCSDWLVRQIVHGKRILKWNSRKSLQN